VGDNLYVETVAVAGHEAHPWDGYCCKRLAESSLGSKVVDGLERALAKTADAGAMTLLRRGDRAHLQP
jgi:hypothetical protein